MRLLKYLQKTKGISRKDFEEMLRGKVIFLNDKLVESFNEEIKKWDTLRIKLPNGNIYEEKIEKLPVYKPVLILFNKPKWYVVSKEDKFNKTIFDILPKSWRKDFYYIWRLDKNSRWLLLLANDPELVDYFSNPKNKFVKVYEVAIDKPFKTSHIKKVKQWIFVDEKWTMISARDFEKMKWMSIEQKKQFLSKFSWKIDKLIFKDVKYIKDKNGRHLLRVILTEWKKRHIRRVLKALWYKILDLKRVKFWKYQLWNIKEWKRKILRGDVWRLNQKITADEVLGFL